MARGDDIQITGKAPPRRNPFRQKILSPEEALAASPEKAGKNNTEQPNQTNISQDGAKRRRQLIDELASMDDLQDVRLKIMENITTDMSSCKSRYLTMPIIEPRSSADQREVQSYLGDDRKIETLTAINILLARLHQETTYNTFLEQETLACLNHFFLANWVRRSQGPIPYMLKNHARLRVSLDDIVHIDNMIKEATHTINQMVLDSDDPDDAMEMKAIITVLQGEFVRETRATLAELQYNPTALD